MSKVIVFTNLTLDGVMQAPRRPDDDLRGDFSHGGWAVPYAVWPRRKDNPLSAMLDTMQKYVASTTLSEPLPWSNSTLLSGDAAEAVARLKGELCKDLVVMGKGSRLLFERRPKC